MFCFKPIIGRKIAMRFMIDERHHASTMAIINVVNTNDSGSITPFRI